jgi:adenylate cyclase
MIDRIKQWKLELLSAAARAALRFETRLLLSIGLLFTVLVISLFFLEKLSARGVESRSDTILKFRLSSPHPAKNIVIVDIDERTLADLAPSHGQWPWSRDIPAEALQKLIDAGAKTVLFGLMMSDADKFRPESDMVMELTARLNKNVAYPLIRLNPLNDKQSQLKITSIPGSKLINGTSENRTIAAILPLFSPMRDTMGIADQRPDEDGIVRNYPFRWVEQNFILPSIILKTLEAAGFNTADLPDSMTLNWRNKHGKYYRVSFSEILELDPTSIKAQRFRDAFIVMGVSAPGIGQNKPTAINAILDDNEILATALDDSLNNTYLRTPPNWLILILTVGGIWGMVYMAIRGASASQINKIFFYTQIILLCSMLLCASYAYYLIDLSGMMSILILVFAGIKLVCNFGHASAGAAPGYRRTIINPNAKFLLLAGLRTNSDVPFNIPSFERKIFRIAGMNNVIRIDDLLGGSNFLSSMLSSYVAFVVLADEEQRIEIKSICDSFPKERMHLSESDLPTDTDIDSYAFKSHITGLLANNAAQLFAT